MRHRFLPAAAGIAFAVAAAALDAPAHAEAIVVGGRVELGGGALPERASAELLRLLDPYSEGRRLLEGGPEPVVDRATPDALGLLQLTAPEAGLYRVRVAAPGHATDEVDVVPLVDPVELPLVRLPPAPTAPVAVRVVGADGEAIRRPQTRLVDLRRADDGAGRHFSLNALVRTGADGLVRAWQPAGLELTIEVAALGHQSRRVEVSRLAETLSLAPLPGAIEREIVALGRDGQPVAGALLLDAEANPVALTGEDGSVRCLLAPGETVLLLASDGRQARWTAGADARGRATLAAGAVLIGTVFDADGAPLRGAWVGASPGQASREPSVSAPPPRAVPTDAAGRYALPVASDSEIWLWAAAAGHLRLRRTERAAPAGRAPDIADFHLPASATVEGVVVDAAGTAVAGVELALEAAFQVSPSIQMALNGTIGRSRQGGVFSFAAMPPATALEIFTAAHGFAPTRTELQSPAARERLQLVIRIDGGTSVSGRVVNGAGEPIAGVAIALCSEREEERVSSRRLRAAESGTVTDEHGRFAQSHVVSGLYRIEARASGYAPLLRPGVAIGGRETDLGDLVLAPGVALAGRVEDEDGEPVAGALVDFALDRRRNSMAHWETPHMVWNEGEGSNVAVRTDGEGRFRFDDLGAGQALELYADAPGFGVQRLPGIVVPHEGELVIRLRRAGSLAGRVVDREGEPLRVGVRLERGTSRAHDFSPTGERAQTLASTRADGAFVAADLPVGEWRLEVRARGYQELVRDGIAIVAGEVTTLPDLVLEREETAVVRGTVSDRSGIGVRATVYFRAPRRMEGTESDSSGAYVLPAVPLGPGEVVAQREGGGSVTAAIEVVAGENLLDFVLEGVTVEGRVVDESAAGVPGATVAFLSPRRSAHSTTAADGTFQLLDLSPGPHRVDVRKDGWASAVAKPIEVGEEGLSGLELVLRRGATIRGRLLGVRQSELAGIAIQAHGLSSAVAEVLADGSYRVTAALPGPWTVSGSSAAGREARTTVWLDEADAVAVADLDFSAPGFMLSGRLSGLDGPYQDAPLTLRNVAGDDFSRIDWTDHQGGFLFGPLPAGTYVIELHDGSGSSRPIVSQTVTIEQDQEIHLTVPK